MNQKQTSKSSMQEDSPRLLVVDDEKVIREILSEFLTQEGFFVRTESDGEAALNELKQRAYDLLIADLKMPKMGGIELLEKINDLHLNVLPIIMTGFGTVETAITAMKKGAYDYILKPFKVEEVVHVVRRGLDRQRLQLENIRLKEALSLYKTSCAISQNLSLEHILNLLVDATVEEICADAMTLLLEDEYGAFRERIRRTNLVGEKITGELRFDEICRFHENNIPILEHGIKSHCFFSDTPNPRLISFCSVPLKVGNHLVGMLNAYSYTRGYRFTEGQRKMLAILSGRTAVSIENARLYENLLKSNSDLAKAKQSLEENFQQTILGFAHALEESDRYTRGHSERVATYSQTIAKCLGLNNQEVETITLAARLHDIGKIGIPTEKLNKPGKLDCEEIDLLHSHTEKGKRILEPIPFLRSLISGVYCHHERFEGNGYPQKLKGEKIPLVGRIIAIADSYDAMTSDRAYRKALPLEAAAKEIIKCSGTQFDPQIAYVFVETVKQKNSLGSDMSGF